MEWKFSSLSEVSGQPVGGGEEKEAGKGGLANSEPLSLIRTKQSPTERNHIFQTLLFPTYSKSQGTRSKF